MAQPLPAKIGQLLHELQSKEDYRRKVAAEDLAEAQVADETVIRALNIVASTDSNELS